MVRFFLQAKYGLDKVSLPFFLVAGSTLQCLLSLALPARWAVVPIASYLAITALNVLLNHPSTVGIPRTLPRNVVPGRTAAQLPLPDGSFRATAAADQVVVFHVGAQFNHALGPLCPGAKETGARFDALHADIVARREELGMLSTDAWTTTMDGSFTTLVTMYFRDIESLHKFAHEEMHRKAWDWFAAQKFPHIGVFHEMFLVPKNGYEAVFLNCKPFLMGGVASLARSEEGEEKWVNALVSADTPALKTQYSRMGRDRNGIVIE